MAVSIIGADAAFIEAVEIGSNDWFMRVKQSLAGKSTLTGTLREIVGTSQRDTPFTLQVDSGSAGLPAGVEAARLIEHAVGDTAVQTFAARMDPTDIVPYFQRFTGLLAGASIAQILDVSTTPAAASIGVRPILTGERQPQILTSDIVMYWLEVADGMQENAAFASGYSVPIKVTVRSTANPFKRYQRSGYTVMEQK